MRLRALTGLLCLLLSTPGLCGPAGPVHSDRIELGLWAKKQLGEPVSSGSANAASLVVVGAEGVELQQAWGIADLQRYRLCSPVKSTFRVSSITKVFTAVAVAQLAEQGMIHSLDDPVNRYLKRLQLPLNRGEEVTIHHLLTHSAGFDYQRYGIWRGDGQQAEAGVLGEDDLLGYIPGYSRPVGQWAVYSNFGGALLGLLVEDIAGMSLADYLHRKIFQPLGMRYTRLLSDPSTRLVQSYFMGPQGIHGKLQLLPYSPLIKLSMGVESSAADMGRFLRMLLREGELDGVRLLSAESVRGLFRERFRNHVAANGFGMMFDVVRQTPDVTLYMHNGSTPGFSSHLLVVPDRDLAAFVSIAGQSLPDETTDAGMDISTRLMGNSISAPQVIAHLVRDWVSPYRYPVSSAPQGRESELAGTFISDRRALDSAEALLDLFVPPMQVSVDSGVGSYISNGTPAREVSANVFMQEGPWAYREMYAWKGSAPVLVIYGSTILRRIRAWATPAAKKLYLQGLVLVLLAGSWLVFLCGDPWRQRLLRTLLLLQWPLLLAYPLYVLSLGETALIQQVQRMDRTPLVLASALSYGVLALFLGLLWAAFCSWRLAWWGGGRSALLGRIQLVVMALAAFCLLVVLRSLNLPGDI